MPPVSRRTVLLSIAFPLLYANLQDAFAVEKQVTQEKYFEVFPYLQLGKGTDGNSICIMWMSKDPTKTNIACSYKITGSTSWTAAKQIELRPVNGHADFHIFAVSISGLSAGKSYDYNVSRNGKIVFQSTFRSAPAKGSPLHFAVMGDCGKGSDGQATLAQQLKQNNPPLTIIPGDIVYPIGTVHFYKRHFFPYYNADNNAEQGIPFMRSSIFVGCAGNHDVAEGGMMDARDLNMASDSMSYFVLFDQPLNGPITQTGANTPNLHGNKASIDAFMAAAGSRYPRMANFSFDYGDAHFLILDANRYMDWNDEKLRKWVEDDLTASKSVWKFVVFHQPGFNSDMAHREEQRMRLLSTIFEKTGVDLVFSGHSHSYQRSMPLRFNPSPAGEEDREARLGFVMGKFNLDKKYDGANQTKPDGVIYLVSGAGGAPLTHRSLEDDSTNWLPFTKKFFCRQHSFTSCKINGNKLSIEQIADDGTVLDKFIVSKD